MPLTLLSSGSNAHGQLGHSSCEDSYTFQPCNFQGYPNGALPRNTVKILDLATGANHTIALLEIASEDATRGATTEIWGCGDGKAGQLGARYKADVSQPGSSSSLSSPSDVFRKLELPLHEIGLEGYQCKLVAAGWETTYLVFSPPFPRASGSGIVHPSDVIVSMGADAWGDLGIGGKPPSNTKSQGKKAKPKSTPTIRELNRVSLGDCLVNGSPLSSCGALEVKSISASQHHVLVHVRIAGSDAKGKGWIIGWGAARHGQISPPPTGTSSPLSSSNAIQVSPKPSAIVDTPQLVLIEGLDEDTRYLACGVGSQHSVVLKASGALVGLGSNRKGQLNISSLSDVTAIGCTWNGTYAVVSSEGKGCPVRSTGSNTHSQLGCGETGESRTDSGECCQPVFPDSLQGRQLEKLACGSEHVLTLWKARESSSASSPEVWAWGWNEHGNLGLGTTVDAPAPVKVYPNCQAAPDAVDLWAGSGTSWICCQIPDGE
ncbi:regulator of chromosome condensation 1/beta-lactamase-inhibitor protein II [Ephemerocybe angulata]|uniref:Regulator of chromosome condensation 1/beta-lactamase-inhibitor protein II n=1 Tax=Ephemerocybe angulata TaxID=980116 RepID=A0A8H6HXN1_9AGAR|nr:regulator of chromosome condensation 1/beta-lactamase-inhibitor protein II [Tulosesus angulatus]